MLHSRFFVTLTLIATVFLTSSCSRTTQTTSGASYLDRYNDYRLIPRSEDSQASINDLVREVAAVEPILRFPARIGIARVADRRLTTIPGEEMEYWLGVRDTLGDSFGEFVPVNPMIANLAAESVNLNRHDDLALINEIRLGSARQHLDAVLIYEVFSLTESNRNLLKIADLTIIGGYLLPSEQVEAEGFANAILIDVMQGYPYGTADVVVDKETSFTPSNYKYSTKNDLSSLVMTKAVSALSEEVEGMMQQLKSELKHANRE